ncbi:putative short-chain dehydrogenase reductase sdr protein [Favolaschia claudopus]|uniref:Short-chain dehydrogenase reductase sdr protein n=1 Tax=Favolaschia claudopus TaxID=2862362 RepID=A0AAW0EDT4_9AGAR
MLRFFITGSSDGIGLLTAQRLVANGHSVVLHARNASRAEETRAKCPEASAVLVGDLSSLDETKALAAEANKLGPYEAVLHNAGVYSGPSLLTVNTLAPYVLTCLMNKPKQLLFVSSGMHFAGRANVDGGEEQLRRSGYGDTKLHDVMLGKIFAQRWKDVTSFAADPGWVPTKMGGASAPGSIEESVRTFTMAALGQTKAKSGAYLVNSKEQEPNTVAADEATQERLVKLLETMSGTKIPE